VQTQCSGSTGTIPLVPGLSFRGRSSCGSTPGCGHFPEACIPRKGKDIFELRLGNGRAPADHGMTREAAAVMPVAPLQPGTSRGLTNSSRSNTSKPAFKAASKADSEPPAKRIQRRERSGRRPRERAVTPARGPEPFSHRAFRAASGAGRRPAGASGCTGHWPEQNRRRGKTPSAGEATAHSGRRSHERLPAVRGSEPMAHRSGRFQSRERSGRRPRERAVTPARGSERSHGSLARAEQATRQNPVSRRGNRSLRPAFSRTPACRSRLRTSSGPSGALSEPRAERPKAAGASGYTGPRPGAVLAPRFQGRERSGPQACGSERSHGSLARAEQATRQNPVSRRGNRSLRPAFSRTPACRSRLRTNGAPFGALSEPRAERPKAAGASGRTGPRPAIVSRWRRRRLRRRGAGRTDRGSSPWSTL